jgi:uncharacterized protein (DUF885 family)
MICFLRLGTLLAALALSGCGAAPAPPSAPPASRTAAPGDRLTNLVEQYWDDFLRLNPQYLRDDPVVRFDPGAGADISAQFLADALALEKGYLETARTLPREQLTSAAQLTYDLFVRQRELAVESFTYPSELLPVNPFRSMPLRFARAATLAIPTAAASAEEYQRWQARSEQFVHWTAEAIANMREGMRRGYSIPRGLVAQTLPMLAALGADTPTNVFNEPLGTHSGGGQKRFADGIAASVHEKILPAYRELHDFLRDVYLPRARTNGGLSALPLGGAWYAFLIKRETGSHLNAAELHALGLAETERLHGRLQALLAETGFTGNAQAFSEAMDHGPHAVGTPEELLSFYEQLKVETAAAIPVLFEETPQADFNDRPLEAFLAATTPPVSYRRAQNPSAPAILYINTAGLAAHPVVPAAASFLREALPGHHFQIATQESRPDLPRFRRFGGDPGFVEGWGLYAASLGEELGVYKDAESKFSALAAQLSCVAGLVVDTGLNALGWSADQGLEFLRSQVPMDEATARASIDRELALPGEALACALGVRTFQTLRAHARESLGSRFEVRAYHAEILDGGAMPLDMLESRVDLWINGPH